MSKPIPSIVHGIADYVGAIALFMAPILFGFAGINNAAEVIPRVLGVLVLGQALMTNYEVGVIKTLPLRVHLVNDYVVGAFLALSPWLFGFASLPRGVWLPHVVVGLLVIVLAALTDPVVGRSTLSLSSAERPAR